MSMHLKFACFVLIRRRRAAKRAAAGEAPDDSDSSSDEEGGQKRSSSAANWGKSKKAYYDADTADLEIGQVSAVQYSCCY
jgi:hypothetical protein